MCRDTYTYIPRPEVIGEGKRAWSQSEYRNRESFQLTHVGSSSATKKSGDDVCTVCGGGFDFPLRGR